MNDDQSSTVISKSELKELLGRIRTYFVASEECGLSPREEYDPAKYAPVSLKKKYADFKLAVQLGSPLTPFFAGLIILKEEPENLLQTHLDAMRSDFYRERAQAFRDYESQGGKHVIGRLHQKRLLTTPLFEKLSDYPQLDPLLYKLAITPLEDVKKMIDEIEGEKGTYDPSMPVYAKRIKPGNSGGGGDNVDSLAHSLFAKKSYLPPKQTVQEQKQEENSALQSEQHRMQQEQLRQTQLLWQQEESRNTEISRQCALIGRLEEARKQEISRQVAELLKRQEQSRGFDLGR